MTKRNGYNEDDFLTAYKAVTMGMSLRKASALYNISRTTLSKRISTGQMEKRRQGPPTALSDEEELILEQWILRCWGTGFSNLRGSMLSSTARAILEESDRLAQTRHSDFGKHWFTSYCSRHPRVREAIGKYVAPMANHKFGEEQLRTWFDRLGTYLTEQSMDNILQQPSRIFHCMQYKFETVSVMLSYSANCRATPPLLVQALKPKELVLPKGWEHYEQAEATIDAQVMQHYLERVLYPYLVHTQVQFPIILFVDQQKQPPDFKLFGICQKLGIIVVNLYHLAFLKIREAFKQRPLEWFKIAANRLQMHSDFVEVIKDALVYNLTKANMKNAFKTSGIYPFDKDSVDTTNYKQSKEPTPKAEEKCEIVDSENISNSEILKLAAVDYMASPPFMLSFVDFKNIVGSRLLANLEAFDVLSSYSNQSSEEFLSLHKMYAKFKDTEMAMNYDEIEDEKEDFESADTDSLSEKH